MQGLDNLTRKTTRSELTPMAVTKLEARLLKPNALDTVTDAQYDTVVMTTKMTGMMPSSENLSASSWDASFVKTAQTG